MLKLLNNSSGVRTDGLSPKVTNPIIAGMIVGTILLVAWVVTGTDQEALLTAALTVLLSSAGGGVIGAQSPPATESGRGLQVVADEGDVADEWPDAHGDQAGVSPDVAAREGIPEDTK